MSPQGECGSKDGGWSTQNLRLTDPEELQKEEGSDGNDQTDGRQHGRRAARRVFRAGASGQLCKCC